MKSNLIPLIKMKYRDVEIEIMKGDITEVHVDAIVNAANSLMIMGGGVAAAIKRKGGKIIEEEARKYAPVPIGKAIVTTAGKLKAKYVIHTPTMQKPAEITDIKRVYLATKATLTRAKDLGVKSIAFPALGAGVGGVSIYDSIKAMLRAIKEHIDEGTTLNRILLVAYGEKAFREFKRVVKEEKDL